MTVGRPWKGRGSSCSIRESNVLHRLSRMKSRLAIESYVTKHPTKKVDNITKYIEVNVLVGQE